MWQNALGETIVIDSSPVSYTHLFDLRVRELRAAAVGVDRELRVVEAQLLLSLIHICTLPVMRSLE